MILSASQIEAFRDDNPFGCQARWWFEKVDPLRRPVIKDLALDTGDAVHKTLEAFLKGADQGVLHSIVIEARGALEFLLPLRRRVKHVELEFGPMAARVPLAQAEYPMVRIGGIDVRGKIDWLATDIDESGATRGLELGDHKTTSNIAKYGKTPGQVKKSVQMNVYAKWMAETIRPFELLKVTQDFYQTKRGKKFEVVSTTISKRENAESILSIEATIEQMVKASTQKDPATLTPNFKACNIGYGCPHRAVCPHFKSQNGVFDMASLLDAFSSVLNNPAAPPVPGLVKVLPPDAPISNPVEAGGKLTVDPSAHPTDAEIAAAKQTPPPTVPEGVTVIAPVAVPGPDTAPAEETIKKPRRGRPPGAKATADEIAQMQQTAVLPSMPGKVTINKITVRHEAKIGLPNFSSAGASVEMEASFTGCSIEEARAQVSTNVKLAMIEELKTYVPEEQAKAAVKP